MEISRLTVYRSRDIVSVGGSAPIGNFDVQKDNSVQGNNIHSDRKYIIKLEQSSDDHRLGEV